jgi:hypothetical protein
MAREHCEVAAGFGASDTAFVTTNYGGNRTTPRQVGPAGETLQSHAAAPRMQHSIQLPV